MQNQQIRSRKISLIIGKVPPAILHYGIGVFAMIFVLLCFGITEIRFDIPIQVSCFVKSTNNDYDITLLIPINEKNKIKSNQNIIISLPDGYAIYTNTDSIQSQEVIICNEGVFNEVSLIHFQTNPQFRIDEKIKTSASILIDNISLLNYLIQ